MPSYPKPMPVRVTAHDKECPFGGSSLSSIYSNTVRQIGCTCTEDHFDAA